MKRVRILNVRFDTEIRAWEIPAFRGAIAGKTGEDNLLFHNHLPNGGLFYGYPLIQYKQIHRKPAIMCIDHGVEEIHKYFQNESWDLRISGRRLDMRIDHLQMNQFTMQVWEEMFRYKLRNWIALNAENYKKYSELARAADKIALLERVLKGNILSFAKGIGWHVEREVLVELEDIPEPKSVTHKKNKLMAYDLHFRTNVFLPDYIGLGKGVSMGFGMVNSIKGKHKRKTEQKKQESNG